MSVHIGAPKNAVASRVLLPGDPLRAKFIAENYLENSRCYNEVRGMLGYTGTYKGVDVSVQGTGMGMPSHAIYVHELINFYGAKSLIRVGSAGSLQPDVHIRDLVMGLAASTNSSMASLHLDNVHFAPTADWQLVSTMAEKARQASVNLKAGNIFSSDAFYNPRMDDWKKWSDYGMLAVEMEAAALYTIAAQHKVRSLCLLTISDSLVTQEETTSEEREKTFTTMMELALETIVEVEV